MRGTKTPGIEVDGRKVWKAMDEHRYNREGLAGKRLAWNTVAAEIGIAPSGLVRMSLGGTPSTDVFVRILFWLGVFDVRKFIKEQPGEQ